MKTGCDRMPVWIAKCLSAVQSRPKSWHSSPWSAQQNSSTAVQEKIRGRTESDDNGNANGSLNPACPMAATSATMATWKRWWHKDCNSVILHELWMTATQFRQDSNAVHYQKKIAPGIARKMRRTLTKRTVIIMARTMTQKIRIVNPNISQGRRRCWSYLSCKRRVKRPWRGTQSICWASGMQSICWKFAFFLIPHCNGGRSKTADMIRQRSKHTPTNHCNK